MADGWGGMNRGIFRSQVALDMDVALWAMRKNHAEQIVLLAVRLQSWNAAVSHKLSAKDPWPDPLPAMLNLSQLAMDYGCSRRHLGEARASLMQDNILIPLGEGLTINKDVDAWAEGRLSPQAREQSRAAAEIKHPTNRKPQGEPKRAQEGEPEWAQEVSPNGRTQEGGEPRGEPKRAQGWAHPPAHPPSDPGRSKTHASARAREEDFSSLPELNSNSLSTPPPTVEPTLVGGGGGGGTERDKDREKGERLRRWVQDNFGPDLLPARKLNSILSRAAPDEWIQEAIRLAASNAKGEEAISTYANACLLRWVKAGKMDVREVDATPPTVKMTPAERRIADAASIKQGFAKIGEYARNFAEQERRLRDVQG